MTPPRAFLVAALMLAATGCSDRSTPPTAPLLAGDVAMNASPAVQVLNLQLRGIINPEIAPSPAWGHVQVRFTHDGEDGYLVEWRGRLFNPDAETIVAASLFYGGPDALPAPGVPPVFTFFSIAGASCGILDFTTQGITDEEHMPVDIVQNILIDPDLFGVVIGSAEGPLVAGKFGLPNPQEVFGFNPQPDPPGTTRCTIPGRVIEVQPPG